MNIQLDVKQFMTAMGQNVADYPVAPEGFNVRDVVLWQVLIEEEYRELKVALEACQQFKDDPDLYYQLLAEVCAEGTDLVYVLMGLFNCLGLPFGAMFREIHAANMRKVGPDGKVMRREDGKVLKPAGWKPANKLGVVMEARDYKA